MDKQVKFVDDLRSKYPKLYKKNIWPEFDEGWYELVANLSSEIYEKYDKWSSLPDLPYVAQMKEKFGGLRFYLESNTFFMEEPEKYEELDKIIAKYESISKVTCETCGSPNSSVRRKNGYWLKCMCDNCEKNNAVLK
jgi:hypothetical protein